MANAFSIQADFGDYIQPINTDLVNFVLNSKQQKYDYNVAKIDQTIAEFGLDLEREKDKDYVLGKLNGVLNSVNSMGKMDLSNGNVTRDLQQQIRGALDQNMIDAAVSTKNYRNFVGNLQTIKEKNPEQYSDINAAFAMERGGVNSWLNESTDKLDSVSYTPYQDVNGNVTKGIKDLKQFNPERTLDIPFVDTDGTRRIISKKVKDLNEAEIRSYVMSNLDANAQNQLKINGWATFRGANDQQLKDYADSYKKTRTNNYDTDIGLLRQQLKTAPSYQAKDIRDRISVLTSEKNSFTSTMDSLGGDRDTVGRVIMQEQLVDNVSKAYADTSISYELKNDTAYYANAKLQFDKAQAALKAAASKKTKGSGETNQFGNSQIRAIDTPVIHQEDFDPQEETNNIIAQQEAKTSSIAQRVIDGLDPENKKIYQSLRDNEKYSGGMTDAELLDKMNLDLTYTDENGEVKLFKQAMNDLKDTYEDATESYRSTMEDSFDLNQEDVYNEITSEGMFNNNEFPLVQEDGSIIKMDEFLLGNGISLEDFKANKAGIREKVKKSLYLNKAFSQLTDSEYNTAKKGRNATFGDVFLDKEDFDAINNYIKVINPNEDIFDYVDLSYTENNQKLSREEVKNIDSTRPFRIKAKNNQSKAMLDFIRKEDGLFTDARVDSEGRLNKIISFDTDEFKKKLTENFAARSSQSLVIDPNLGKGGKELDDVHVRMRNFVNSKGITEIDAKKPFIVSESLYNKGEVLIFQNTEDGGQPLSVSKNELEQFIGIPLRNSKGERHVINKEVINKDIAPLNTDKASHLTKQKALTSMISKGEILGGAELTKKGLSSNIKLTRGYNDSDRNRTQAGQLADHIISNEFNNLSIAYKPSGDGGYVTVMNKNTQEEIKSYPVERNQVPVFRNTVRYNPQLFIAQSLQDMLQSFESEGTDSELFNKLVQSQNATRK